MRLLALSIACDIHALNIPCVLNYLVKTLGVSEEQKNTWNCHWVARGFAALEARLAAENEADLFFHGKQPTLADICLISQLFNARRFDGNPTAYLALVHIERNCRAVEAFRQVAPERQPDAA